MTFRELNPGDEFDDERGDRFVVLHDGWASRLVQRHKHVTGISVLHGDCLVFDVKRFQPEPKLALEEPVDS